MRKIEKRVFLFSELNDEAKEKAIEYFQNNFEYYRWEDNAHTLNDFCDIFPIKLKDWRYGGNENYIRFEMTCEYTIQDLYGIRLLKYLYNNYYQYLWKGKYYSKAYRTDDKWECKSRHSRIIMDNSFVLTGYCMDNAILEPIYKFMKKPNSTTFSELMKDCLESWLHACNKDYEYQCSNEVIAEVIEINGYEFYADGTLFY